ERDPVHAGRFDGYGGDPAGCQPISQRVQILGQCPEPANWFSAALFRYRHVVMLRAGVDACCPWVDHVELPDNLSVGPEDSRSFGHSYSPQSEVAGPQRKTRP